MTALTGAAIRSIMPADGALVSADIYTQDGIWSPGEWAASSYASGSLWRGIASAITRSISGHELRSYFDDFYNRIHIAPARIDLGNVASVQVTPTVVWNAYLSARELTDITSEDAEGISITGPGAPRTVNALEVLTYQTSVSLDGPPTADARLTWVFTGEPDSVLPITATRVIPFSFLPDWAAGIKESLEWMTDILRAPTGHEQRRALRLSPRRSFEAAVIVDDDDRRYFDMSLWGWSARAWAMPLWHDIQSLLTPLTVGAMTIPCTTSNFEFEVGGLVMLRGQRPRDVEVAVIDVIDGSGLTIKRALQRDWPVGARIYPCRTAQLAQMPVLSRLTDAAQSTNVSFRVIGASDFPEAAPATLYRGWPVLTDRPDETEDLTSSMQRLLLELDNATGAVARVDTADRAFVSQSHRYEIGGRIENAALRSLLYYLQGRYRAVWLPTHAADLVIVDEVPPAQASIRIENIGYSRFAGSASGRRDIQITMKNGTVYRRHVTGSSEDDSATETLALDAVFGATINPANIERISWMSLCRMDSDNVELHHETDAAGITTAQLIFRGVRDEF